MNVFLFLSLALTVLGENSGSCHRCQGQKQKCIESLNKLRMARGDDGKAAPENNLLQALLSATMEDIDTDDIPELEQTSEYSDDVVE